MDFAKAEAIVAKIPKPHTHRTRGRALYDHIRRTRPEKLLELGTARAGSAVFTAAALEANGLGHLTSVDSLRWTWRNPSPQEVLDAAGLSHRVTLNRDYSTYTWFLKTEIERCTDDDGVLRPEYDFIFIDGAKNWTTDGLAVLLAEKLLRKDGWLLLDDLDWSYARNTKSKRHYEVNLPQLSESERTQPHLRAVFDLLVRSNPVFDQFEIQDNWWAWAHKSASEKRQMEPQMQSTPEWVKEVDSWVRKARKLRRDPLAFVRDAVRRR